MIKRYPILNIWVDAVDMHQVLEKVDEYVKGENRPHTIFASNPEKNFSVTKDLILYETFKNADLLIPDGIGIVYAARILYGIRLCRITGIRVMHEICKVSSIRGYKIFIYGAAENVSKAAAEKLEKLFPGIQIVGRANGYLSEATMDDLVKRINESGAQILFLALGSPKQERWFSRYRDRLTNVRVCQGIGGTLDVLAGKAKRAPAVFRRLGLEWLYRLIVDPKRLKRQSVYPVFAILILWEKLKALLVYKKMSYP